MIDEAPRSGFYRKWSSRAAREALETSHQITKERCSLSASIWCSIADAIEARDEARVTMLTRNISFMPMRYLVPIAEPGAAGP